MKIRAASALSALPDVALAVLALMTWINPHKLGTGFVRFFVMLMLVEFIVVHSAAFMGQVAFSSESRRRRALGTILLGLFYSVFLIGFSLGFKTWWPLITFWLLMLNRLLGVLIGQAPEGKEREFVQSSWAAGAMFYILCIIPAVILPLPELGIRPEMIGEVSRDSGGQWLEEPHRAVVFAILYFGMTAWSGAYGHRWLQRPRIG